MSGATSSGRTPTVVLVHGAFADASGFRGADHLAVFIDPLAMAPHGVQAHADHAADDQQREQDPEDVVLHPIPTRPFRTPRPSLARSSTVVLPPCSAGVRLVISAHQRTGSWFGTLAAWR